jgi:hypothetical protein
MNQPAYQKLPGRGRTWSGQSRIWLGTDHILYVMTRGYVENYRRFFFNDIHGIIVQRTQTGKMWTAVWSVPLFFFVLFAILIDENAPRVAFAILATPFAVGFISNLILGPTCACYIRTAVQTERIPAVSRVRSAEKFIALIEPHIHGAQGELSQEQIASDLALLQAGQLGRATEPARADLPPVIS